MSRGPLLSSIGTRVRELREKRGLSRAALAGRSHVSTRFLAELEAGEGNISVLRLADVARALGTAAGEILMVAEERSAKGTDRRIALLGLRGAGKSTLGAQLAERT